MSLANKYPCILPGHFNPSTFLSGRVFAEVTGFVPRQVQQGAVDWTLLPVIWTLYIHVQLCVSACEKGGWVEWGGGGVLKGVRGWRHKAAFYDGCVTTYSVHTCTVLWAYYFVVVVASHTVKRALQNSCQGNLAGNISMVCMYSILLFCSPDYCYTNACISSPGI